MRRADSQIEPRPARFDTAAGEWQASGHPPAGARSTRGCAPKATPRGVGGGVVVASHVHGGGVATACVSAAVQPLRGGHRFGAHIDNSIRQHRQIGARIRRWSA